MNEINRFTVPFFLNSRNQSQPSYMQMFAFSRQAAAGSYEISNAAEVFQTTLLLLKKKESKRQKRSVSVSGKILFQENENHTFIYTVGCKIRYYRRLIHFYLWRIICQYPMTLYICVNLCSILEKQFYFVWCWHFWILEIYLPTKQFVLLF